MKVGAEFEVVKGGANDLAQDFHYNVRVIRLTA